MSCEERKIISSTEYGQEYIAQLACELFLENTAEATKQEGGAGREAGAPPLKKKIKAA